MLNSKITLGVGGSSNVNCYHTVQGPISTTAIKVKTRYHLSQVTTRASFVKCKRIYVMF